MCLIMLLDVYCGNHLNNDGSAFEDGCYVIMPIMLILDAMKRVLLPLATATPLNIHE